jgi:isoleucyl-tRNA synthetase
VTRYAHQTGHHVVRRFGWDCHGLPVEFEIDTQLGIKTRDQVGFGRDSEGVVGNQSYACFD